MKDASDLLQAGRVKAITQAVYEARGWRPDGVVAASEITARVLADVAVGTPWPWKELTAATFGRREGEVYALGAGTGVGKTDVFTQIIAHDVLTLGIRCGVLYLEQPVAETGRRVAGKSVGRRFHVPDGSWTKDELAGAWGHIEASGNLFLFEAFGATDWDIIKSRIRYMVVSLECRHIFLDHLTALAAAVDDERVALEKIMAELSGMAQELGFVLHFISHLATPDGTPHEEGGRVMVRHFKGSRAIGFWSHFMFGLERDQQAEDPEERSTTTLRCLKDRFTGGATGMTLSLLYDNATGLLSVGEPRPKEGGFSDHGGRKDF